MTEIYLGNPPTHIKQWIENHTEPVAIPETTVTLTDGSTVTQLVSGTLTNNIIKQMANNDMAIVKAIYVGTAVTRIDNGALDNALNVESIEIAGDCTVGSYVTGGYCEHEQLTTIKCGGNLSWEYASFACCKNLTTVEIKGELIPDEDGWSASLFMYAAQLSTLKIGMTREKLKTLVMRGYDDYPNGESTLFYDIFNGMVGASSISGEITCVCLDGTYTCIVTANTGSSGITYTYSGTLVA